MGTWRDRSCFEGHLLRCDRADGPELATHDPEVMLALARPAIRLVPAAGGAHEVAPARGIGVDPPDRPSEIPCVARLEHLEAVVAEVGAHRGRSRDERGLPHRDEVEHLVAMRDVAERIALHRDDAGIGLRDRPNEIVERYPALAELDTVRDLEVTRETLERGAIGPAAEEP